MSCTIFLLLPIDSHFRSRPDEWHAMSQGVGMAVMARTPSHGYRMALMVRQQGGSSLVPSSSSQREMEGWNTYYRIVLRFVVLFLRVYTYDTHTNTTLRYHIVSPSSVGRKGQNGQFVGAPHSYYLPRVSCPSPIPFAFSDKLPNRQNSSTFLTRSVFTFFISRKERLYLNF